MIDGNNKMRIFLVLLKKFLDTKAPEVAQAETMLNEVADLDQQPGESVQAFDQRLQTRLTPHGSHVTHRP